MKVQLTVNATFQDPVKYPDDMSQNFKNFLKGLLNKVGLWLRCSTLSMTSVNMIHSMVFRFMKQVPQNRLAWPALLEHPFVKETSDEVEARVMIYHITFPLQLES